MSTAYRGVFKMSDRKRPHIFDHMRGPDASLFTESKQHPGKVTDKEHKQVYGKQRGDTMGSLKDVENPIFEKSDKEKVKPKKESARVVMSEMYPKRHQGSIFEEINENAQTPKPRRGRVRMPGTKLNVQKRGQRPIT